jgi:hypothetical protein
VTKALSRRPIFLILTAHHDLERIIRQWPLQRLRLVPMACASRRRGSSAVVRITGMALGWIGSTTVR